MWTLIAIASVKSAPPPELNKPMLFAFLGFCVAAFCLVEYFLRRSYRKPGAHRFTPEERRRIESRLNRLFAPMDNSN